MPLSSVKAPFSHPDWVFEVKWDGFRSLAHLNHGECQLISRNGNAFKSFPALNRSIPAELNARSAVLDGEIVCLDRHGRPQFRDLLFRHGEPRFCAFDLLWCDGEDLRHRPIHERKSRLFSIIQSRAQRLFYCDHVERDGDALFRLACEHDLEGIVAKQMQSTYCPDVTGAWLKIRNKRYTQWEGREELFEKERAAHPDFGSWESCVAACAEL